MTLRQRLDEIRTLEQKATPMPWAAWNHYVDRQVAPNASVPMDAPWLCKCDCDQNAALIAAMRNAIGPLLEVVEQQHRALKDTTTHLIAAHSLLQQGGKKAAPSDAMFVQMLADYEKSFEQGRAALSLMDKEVK